MGLRLVFPLRRLPHLSREEFQAYWWDHHGPLVAERAEMLGIRRYQQVHTRRSGREGTVDGFDGIAELWLDGPAPTGTLEQRAQGGADLLADERTFIDLSRSPLWMAEEVVVVDGPMASRDGLRLTSFLRRRADLTRAEFLQHWQHVHAPLPLEHADVFGFGRYLQLHTSEDAEDFPLRASRGAPAPFDGMAEIWLNEVSPDPERAKAARAIVTADEELFFDRHESPLVFGEVRVVVDRT